mmetsp:Transcript_36382/g.97185  ORF Transcript_36382/g.97185 Transcript_36382/m.97185 type:complete len:247 (-) Transcript_36382:2227-2967(-)
MPILRIAPRAAFRPAPLSACRAVRSSAPTAIASCTPKGGGTITSPCRLKCACSASSRSERDFAIHARIPTVTRALPISTRRACCSCTSTSRCSRPAWSAARVQPGGWCMTSYPTRSRFASCAFRVPRRQWRPTLRPKWRTCLTSPLSYWTGSPRRKPRSSGWPSRLSSRSASVRPSIDRTRAVPSLSNVSSAVLSRAGTIASLLRSVRSGSTSAISTRASGTSCCIWPSSLSALHRSSSRTRCTRR